MSLTRREFIKHKAAAAAATAAGIGLPEGPRWRTSSSIS